MDQTTDTAFLQENTAWVDKRGNEHQLTDMTENYLRHVLIFLDGIADTLFAAEIDEINSQQLVAIFEPWRFPNGHRPVDFPTAQAWLSSTPLVKAITGILAN